MDLLDSESKVIEEINKNKTKKKSGRKAKNSGLNRFASSLNKYKKLADDHRSTNQTEAAAPKKKTAPKKKPFVESTETVTANEEVIIDTAPEITAPKEIEPTAVEESPVISNSPQAKVVTPTVPQEEKPNILEYKAEINKSTNRVQQEYALGNNKSTNGVQKEYELDNNKSTNGVHIGAPNGVHIPNDIPIVRLLTGQNRKLLDIFFRDCKSQGSLQTGRFSNENLCKSLEMKPSTLKTIVYRLVKGGFIERLPGKRGRGGWVQISIPKEIYSQLNSIENASKIDVLTNSIAENKSTIKSTNWSTNPPSSSSNNLIEEKTTTTRALPEEWNHIQIPETLKENGFSMAHIKQLHSDHFLSSDEVQDSLDAFAYDLSKGEITANTSYIRLFMGIVRKRKSPYVSQALIEEEKVNLEAYMNKIQQAKETQKEIAEIALVKKFEKVWASLPQEQKNEIAPPSSFIEEGSDMQERVARGRYLEDQSILG